jgi:peptidoglycan pentaglycine glycine transferase (the first glycine)
MQVVHVADSQSWDRALLALPNPHVLQSWAWGEFKSEHGWCATRLLFQEEGRPVAAASVLRRKLPWLPLSVSYVAKGPILDWTNTALAARVLAELERLARQRGSVFVKIDPDVYYPGDVPPTAGSILSRPACAPTTEATLRARRWRFSDEQIQFRNTVLLDLRRSEEDLLAAMKQKTRYNVRLATRRGVTVRQASAADLDRFYQLYAETAQRDGFPIRPADYYLGVWQRFLQSTPRLRTGQAASEAVAGGRASLLLAEVEGEVVAGLLLFTLGSAAWYMYGASSNRHRERMPNQLLQWEAMRWARAAGCDLYDLWGAPDALDESDPMWGVLRFKLGLGGRLVQGLGAWDFVANRLAYRLYTVVIPRYLGWLRGQRELDQAPPS